MSCSSNNKCIRYLIAECFCDFISLVVVKHYQHKHWNPFLFIMSMNLSQYLQQLQRQLPKTAWAPLEHTESPHSIMSSKFTYIFCPSPPSLCCWQGSCIRLHSIVQQCCFSCLFFALLVQWIIHTVHILCLVFSTFFCLMWWPEG